MAVAVAMAGAVVVAIAVGGDQRRWRCAPGKTKDEVVANEIQRFGRERFGLKTSGLRKVRQFERGVFDHIADRDEASGNYPETRITSKEEKPENLIFNFTVSHLAVLSLEKGLKKGLKILFLNCDFQRLVTTQ